MSANATLAEMAFYRTERPILIAQGIVDYDQQCTLLTRRWIDLLIFLSGGVVR